jgi:phosphoserine phosphatase RsbU/P
VTPAPATAKPETFEDYRDSLLHGWLKVLTTLGYSLVPLFFILDSFMMPRELLNRFGLYRLMATLIILGQHFVVRRTAPSRSSYMHGYIFSLVTGAMIVQMTIDLGGFNSTYYAGLNLVIVAVNLLLPWHAVHSALNGLGVMIIYVLANLVFGATHDTKDIINNLYFMGGTVVIAVALTAVRFKQIHEEFRLRQELLQVNERLDRSAAELKSARDALWGEMEVAKRIQTALLPADRRLGRYDVAAVMQPATEVGGDYYDFFETRHGERWLAIGDVSGHGVESGLVMMMTQTAISTMVNDSAARAPSDVLAGVNRMLRENIARLGSTRFMTLNVVRLENDGLTWSGKHQDLLVWRSKSRQVEVVTNEGTWVGVVADTAGLSPDARLDLEAGDAVLFFTDGATEATNASGEMFGQDRLTRLFAEVADRAPAEVVASIIRTVNGWQTRQDDDLTLVMVRCASGG